jgi:hypothetical protein
MNTSKLAIVAASLALGLGANFASAAQLNIDTLIYKTSPSKSVAATMVEKGPVQLEIDTLVVKASTSSTKTRAEVRSEIAMAPKSNTLNY